MSDAVADVAGERLHLLAEHAVYWERAAMLLVADLHFGKAAAFRAAGVPVPHGTTTGTLQRLDAALARCSASHVVFLGDLLHALEGRDPGMLRALHTWRARHRDVTMTLVRGNHDARAGDLPDTLDVHHVTAPLIAAPFVLTHHPVTSDAGYVLAGHVHPAVRLIGAARERTRLPCFWFGARTGVLPAFGEFTGLGDVDPLPGDQVFVVAGDSVVRVAPPATPSPQV